ncbi:MAG: FAD-dependent oxidoreductase, partial [Rickettsiales bacterium]|nr:FAD-dependent oxidoreductase [Rickettsiales bacterium]
GAAYLLNQKHEITVYEKNPYIGGHSRTVEALGSPVDTGFIVFNYRNYPLLTGLFTHLDVAVEKSNMSFGASIQDGWLEYGTDQLSDLFAQKRNYFRPKFYFMIRDILKFNKEAMRFIDKDTSITLGQCLDELKMGEWFKRYYLLAMGGAIWSCPLEQMLEFPAKSFVRFFHNHGLLTVNDQPQWYTVTGGSREYVKKLSASFKDRIRMESSIKTVSRKDGVVTVEDTNGNSETFDAVVFACHSDQAIRMLEAPTEDEHAIIGAFGYQGNKVILHSDERFMPVNKKAWASWIYLSQSQEDQNPAISLSYWMNNLQNMKTEKPLIVTLNPGSRPDESLIYDEYIFEHPVFDRAAIDAQDKIDQVQGVENTYYCGAYQRNGFHEDGLWSAVNVAKQLGCDVPWN